MCIVPRIIKEPTIIAARPPTTNIKNLPTDLMLANTYPWYGHVIIIVCVANCDR